MVNQIGLLCQVINIVCSSMIILGHHWLIPWYLGTVIVASTLAGLGFLLKSIE